MSSAILFMEGYSIFQAENVFEFEFIEYNKKTDSSRSFKPIPYFKVTSFHIKKKKDT